MGLPTDSTHLTQLSRNEMEAVFTGMLETRYSALSIAREYFKVRGVQGTNAWFNRFFGKTKMNKVTAGVRPDADRTTMARKDWQVDTIVITRNNVDLLNNVQADIDLLGSIAEDQGKTHAKFFDEALFSQIPKGSVMPEMAGLDGAIKAGKSADLATGEHTDPDKLVEAITEVTLKMREEDIPAHELTILVAPSSLETLIKNEKLTNRDYSPTNADYAKRQIYTLSGIPIRESTVLPFAKTPVGEHHYLSNAENGNRYDIDEKTAKACALLVHPRAITAGASIELTGNIWYSKEELQFFIDAYASFGAGVNRPDLCGAVFAADELLI